MTTLTTSSRRLLSEAVKKQVAYRQQWKCSVCRELLPPSYQIDHTIPLCDGGADDESNTTAMCPTCHANKTQQEHINRHYHSVSKKNQYETREDVRVPNGWRCTLCNRTRSYNAPHNLCIAIEDPTYATRAVLNNLSAFAYVGRF